MNAWKVATELTYDFKVEVYNKAGELIATHELSKVEPKLEPAGAMPVRKIQKKVINHKYPEVMTKLFQADALQKALQ